MLIREGGKEGKPRPYLSVLLRCRLSTSLDFLNWLASTGSGSSSSASASSSDSSSSGSNFICRDRSSSTTGGSSTCRPRSRTGGVAGSLLPISRLFLKDDVLHAGLVFLPLAVGVTELLLDLLGLLGLFFLLLLAGLLLLFKFLDTAVSISTDSSARVRSQHTSMCLISSTLGS